MEVALPTRWYERNLAHAQFILVNNENEMCYLLDAQTTVFGQYHLHIRSCVKPMLPEKFGLLLRCRVAYRMGICEVLE